MSELRASSALELRNETVTSKLHRYVYWDNYNEIAYKNVRIAIDIDKLFGVTEYWHIMQYLDFNYEYLSIILYLPEKVVGN